MRKTLDKYLDSARRPEKAMEMKMSLTPVVVGVLGTVSRNVDLSYYIMCRLYDLIWKKCHANLTWIVCTFL